VLVGKGGPLPSGETLSGRRLLGAGATAMLAFAASRPLFAAAAWAQMGVQGPTCGRFVVRLPAPWARREGVAAAPFAAAFPSAGGSAAALATASAAAAASTASSASALGSGSGAVPAAAAFIAVLAFRRPLVGANREPLQEQLRGLAFGVLSRIELC